MSELLKSLSFREKSLWVELAVMVYLWVWYFGKIGNGLLASNPDPEQTFSFFITMIVVVIIVSVFSQIVLAIVSHKDADAPADERDRLFAWRAGSHASYLLGAGIIMIAFYSMVNEISAVVMVHMLVLLLVAVEILTNALQIFYYRRGF